MGQVVVLEGEAGIGKSRLVQVLKDHVAGEAHTWLGGRGSPYYQHTARYPLIDLLQRWPCASAGRGSQQIGNLRPSWRSIICPGGGGASLGRPPGPAAPGRLSPPGAVARAAAAPTLHLLWPSAALAAKQPVLFVIEDLHWVDPSTLEILGLLVDQGPPRQHPDAVHLPAGLPLALEGHAAPEVEQVYTQAYALCQQAGETSQLVQVLLGLWRFYVSRPQLHTAREFGETLLRLAQRTNAPALAVIAHTALGATRLSLGALPAARAHLEEGRACYTPDQHRTLVFRMGQDPGVACRLYVAATLVAGVPGASPGPPPRGPHVGIRAVPSFSLRVRGVRRPLWRSFAGMCRPCTSTPRPLLRLRPSRAFQSGLPWEQPYVGGR